MQHEEQVRVVAAYPDARPAADAREDEEQDGERKHRKTEQAVARLTAPDQVGPHHEPDEEIERAAPRRPREAVRGGRLNGEQGRLDEPAHPDAPGREPTRKSG